MNASRVRLQQQKDGTRLCLVQLVSLSLFSLKVITEKSQFLLYYKQGQCLG